LTDLENAFVSPNITLIDAIKALNNTSEQILLVVNENKQLFGTVTDGDIRRALIEKIDFDKPVATIMKKKPVVLFEPVNKNIALQLMKKFYLRQLPVVNRNKTVVDMILWKDIFKEELEEKVPKKTNSVIIMAGGKGKRLDLFTKILPKPLIPVGDKPIVEHVITNFKKYGFDNFFISVNYKKEMIKSYFSEDSKSNISFIEEKKYLGTAGALSLCKEIVNDTFIVSNCDIIMDADIEDFFKYHKKNKCDATILGTVQNIKIPYGVLNAYNGILESITEKPEYNFIVNAGVYILEPKLLKFVDDTKKTDMTELLITAQENNYNIHVYPIICSWFDVGQWDEYKKAVDHVNSMNNTNDV